MELLSCHHYFRTSHTCRYEFFIGGMTKKLDARVPLLLFRSELILCEFFSYVGSAGLEPATHSLKGYCSNRLSYEPDPPGIVACSVQ